MSLIIEEITDKNTWEDFLKSCTEKTFLQSWNWGEFQKSLGKKIWRFGIFKNNILVSAALTIETTAKRGSFLLVPHGPVVGNDKSQTTNHKSEILTILVEKLRELAKEEKIDFIRINPIWERTGQNEALFKEAGFRLRALHTHPESSWKLNIEKSENELFSGMRKTTRYLIRQAETNKDLEIFQSQDIKDIETFNSMHLEVVKQQKFVPFSLEYFRKEFLAFLPDGQIILLFAKYKGEVIAASYGIFWSGMGFYHHAALLPQHKKIPASYLLQWHAIQESKKRGCNIYDFWGYSDPVKNPKHPYSGPTLFKMGFGGYKSEYVRAQDLIITKKYWLNYIVETMRRIRRGL